MKFIEWQVFILNKNILLVDLLMRDFAIRNLNCIIQWLDLLSESYGK